MHSRSCALLWLTAAAASFVVEPPAQEPTVEAILGEGYQESIEPLLQDWCSACHDTAGQKGGFAFESWAERSDRHRLLVELASVRDRLRAGDMPPPGADPMPGDERERLAAWAAEAVARWAPRVPVPPGRTTLRRLSRSEIERTLHDLFGIASPLVEQLPADDLGYGFDNIGDAVSFSPLRLEKLERLARDVATRVVHPRPDEPQRARVDGADLEIGARYGRASGGAARLFSNGPAGLRLDVTRGGSFLVRARLSGDMAGDDLPTAELRVDGANVARFEVKAGSGDPEIVEASVKLDAGDRLIELWFVNDYYRPDGVGKAKGDRNLHVHAVEISGPSEPWRPPEGARWLHDLDPGEGVEDREGPLVDELAQRAWRRPPSAAERQRLSALAAAIATQEGTFWAGIQGAVEAVLLSPHFVFRVEEAAGRHRRPLSGFELATRLSYLVWGSMPDLDLRAAASRGDLGTVEGLRGQLDRMLEDDSKVDGFVRHFAGQWLELRSLDDLRPDPERFAVDRALLAAMGEESRRLVAHVIARDLPVRELLRAERSFVNRDLARHYGWDWPGGEGDGFVPVAVPAARRVGILAHGSVLSVTSNPTRTSPVKRGKWILDNLLGAGPPPPPPGSDSFENEQAVAAAPATLREQLALHRGHAECAACHQRMDAFGLALERFDAVGRVRGESVDTSSQLPDGRSLTGAIDLRDVLLEGRGFERAVLRRLFVFAIGREPEPADEVSIEAMAAALPAEPTFSQMLREVVALDAFRFRGEEQPR